MARSFRGGVSSTRSFSVPELRPECLQGAKPNPPRNMKESEQRELRVRNALAAADTDDAVLMTLRQDLLEIKCLAQDPVMRPRIVLFLRNMKRAASKMKNAKKANYLLDLYIKAIGMQDQPANRLEQLVVSAVGTYADKSPGFRHQ